jgi:hypothetical protein
METTAPSPTRPSVAGPAGPAAPARLTRYAGLRADGALFRPMALLAAELRGLGVDVVTETGLPSAAPVTARCREALRTDPAATILHVEAGGSWPAPGAGLATVPTQAGPGGRPAAALLTAGLVVTGGAWADDARAALAALFAPGTLVLGSDAPTTKGQLTGVVRSVVLAAAGRPVAEARAAVLEELAAVPHEDSEGRWELRTVADLVPARPGR